MQTLRFARLLLPTCLLLLSACGGGERTGPAADGSADGAPPRLVIVSPHTEMIRNEFEQGFADWHVARGGGARPEIEWQDRGGTVEMIKYLISTYEAAGDKDEGIGIDLVFGGGMEPMEQLKKAGDTMPAALPAEVIEAIPAELAGVPLRDPEGHWFGAVLSSFGIVFNKPGLARLGIAPPMTWADLANPAYEGHVVLADPSKSGSARVCYEVILQKHGWEEGWGLTMEIAGNTREFTPSSSGVPGEVAQGSALAGLCIDFYAYGQIAETGGDVVGYVSPENATAITPDPIVLLRGAPHRELAEAFMTYVLSPAGQSLWLLKPGTPGGPRAAALWRTPILPAAYEGPAGDRLVDYNPFTSTTRFNLDMGLATARAPLLGPLFKTAFMQNSQLVRQAWDAVKGRPLGDPLRARFRAVPFSQEESLRLAAAYGTDPRQAMRLETEWQQLFAERYRAILSEAGQ